VDILLSTVDFSLSLELYALRNHYIKITDGNLTYCAVRVELLIKIRALELISENSRIHHRGNVLYLSNQDLEVFEKHMEDTFKGLPGYKYRIWNTRKYIKNKFRKFSLPNLIEVLNAPRNSRYPISNLTKKQLVDYLKS
jgi:hypothetical protein